MKHFPMVTSDAESRLLKFRGNPEGALSLTPDQLTILRECNYLHISGSGSEVKQLRYFFIRPFSGSLRNETGNSGFDMRSLIRNEIDLL